MRAKTTTKESAAPGNRPIDRGILPELIGYHLRRAQLAVFQDFGRAVGAAELTPGQFGVLMVVDRNPGLSQTRLGQTLGIDRSTLVAVIDRLENRGLIERANAPHDRRSYALHLSAQGKTLLEEMVRAVRAHEAQIAGNLTAAEKEQLIALLRRIGPAPEAD